MTHTNKLYTVLINSIVAVIFLFAAGHVLFSDIANLISVTPDDASYYLKIAENYTFGKGFTFDNINGTNGFQPLWEFLIIPVMFISDSMSQENKLRIILFLQLILLSLSFIVFNKILSRYYSGKFILAFSICFAVFVYFNALNGMESSLMILLTSLLFRSAVNSEIFNEEKGSGFFFGIILGLLILSRLDMIFIAVCIFIFLIPGFRKDGLAKAFKIILGTSVIVLPYLLYNLTVFGNVIPVSGYLKAGFSIADITGKLRLLMQYRESYFLFFSVVFLIWHVLSERRSDEDRKNSFSAMVTVLIISNALLFLYMLLFLNWVIFYWYFIPFSLTFSVLTCIVFSNLLKDRKSAFLNISYFAVISFISVYWGYKIYFNYSPDKYSTGNNWNIESYNAAIWTRNHTDMQDNFAMKDAGHFSFFSGRNVINLDGLANNFEYQEVLKNKKLNEYLINNHVKYISQHALWKRDEITSGDYDTLSLKFVSHKYSAESDPVILHKADEVYRSEPYFDDGNRTVFIIWKLNRDSLNNNSE